MTERDTGGMVELVAQRMKDVLNEDGTFDIRSPDECSLDDRERGEWEALVRAAEMAVYTVQTRADAALREQG